MLFIRIIGAAIGALLLFVVIGSGVVTHQVGQKIAAGHRPESRAHYWPDERVSDAEARMISDYEAADRERDRQRREGISFEPGKPMVDPDPAHRH